MIKQLLKRAISPILTMALTISVSANASDKIEVTMTTNMGEISIVLDAAKAPVTVENFLRYVDEGYYNGTIFHRVIPDFMAQGGGFDKDYKKKPTHDTIKNEADNGLKNNRGTLAMARTNAPHSASAQFFINVKDNDFLNHSAKNSRGWGYTVFGEVIKGMKIVDQIQHVRTGRGGPFPANVPKKMIVIEKMTRLIAK
ncbi:MAG: peptidyl-prolyl cis-trans isomerase [Thiotrichaceae bacterium]|nr:peptidyl-prolyl cis-trans isomerase [Thiotrichaceae bacterium]PCI13162.1 MAG: cyclophilin [Thiotrichales bacterium]